MRWPNPRIHTAVSTVVPENNTRWRTNSQDLENLAEGPSSRHRAEPQIICLTEKATKWLVQVCPKGCFGSRTKGCETIDTAIKGVACIPPWFQVSPEDNQASLLGLLAKIKV